MTIIPAFLLSAIGPVAVVIATALPTLLFFAWQRQCNVPKRTYVLLGAVVALSFYWFIGGWSYGLQYQGPRLTHLFCAVNVVWDTFLVLVFIANRKRQASFKANLFLHWMLFAWLAWYAFPYLGEMP